MPRIGAVGVLLALACSPGESRGRGEPGTPPVAAQVAAGEALFWRGQLDSAQATFQTALVNARALGDGSAEARALTWMGRTARELGDYEAARRDGEQALQLKLRLELTDDLFDSYNALGLLAWNQGRLVEAESLLTAASRAAAATSDNLGVGKALGNLGLVRVELGDYAGARAGLEAMLVAGRAAQDPRVEGNALANLAMLDIREGNPRAAVPRLMESRLRYQKIAYRAGEANALGQLATAWEGLGDFQAAFASADSALMLARQDGLKQEEAAELEVIAMLYRETGDFPSALQCLEDAQRINGALDLRVEAGTDRRREADIRREMGQIRPAIEGATDALRIHAGVGAQPERLNDLLFLAEVDSARAKEWLRQARALADSMGTRKASASVGLSAARLAIRSRDWAGAVTALRGAGRGVVPDDAVSRWEFAQTEASAYRGTGDLEKAERAARRAVDAVERIRGSLGPAWSRSRFLALRADSYVTLTEILLARGRVDDAFVVADAARGRALLEHLAGLDSSDRRGSSLLASLASRELTLRRIDDLEQQLAGIGEEASLEATRTRSRLRGQLSALQAEYRRPSPGQSTSRQSAALLGGVRVDVGRLRAALAPDEAVVEYLVGSEHVHLFVVRHDAVRHVTLKTSSADLVTRVRVARDLAGRRAQPSSSAQVLGALHEILLGPAAAAGWLADVRRLVVVPHGALGYVSFAALRDLRKERYLVEDMVVMTVPSAASFVAARASPPPMAGLVNEITALAPFPERLPGTGEELDAVARVAHVALSLSGASATEEAVRSASRTPRVLHLATHGVLNPDNPLFSRMELRSSRVGAVPGPTDGQLEVHEVLGLELLSPLVYLSGCETALGEIGLFTRGDDFLTLSQAFLFAGARTVIATLWRIPDSGSVPLVEAFYAGLPGHDFAESLALAQRKLIASPDHSSPYFWAGYVMTGDGGSPARLGNTIPVETTAGLRTVSGDERY